MYIPFQFHLVTQTRRLDKRLDASVNGYMSKEHEGIIKRPFLSRACNVTCMIIKRVCIDIFLRRWNNIVYVRVYHRDDSDSQMYKKVNVIWKYVCFAYEHYGGVRNFEFENFL